MFRDGMLPAYYLWGLWSGLLGVERQSPHSTGHGTLAGRARIPSHKGGRTLVAWVAWPWSGSPGSRCDAKTRGSSPSPGPCPYHPCSLGRSLLKARRASLWIWLNHKESHPRLARKQVIFSIRGQQMKKKVMSRKEWLCRNLAHSEEGWPPCLFDKMLGAKELRRSFVK